MGVILANRLAFDRYLEGIWPSFAAHKCKIIHFTATWSLQVGCEPHLNGCSLGVGRGDTLALPGHCMVQAKLRLQCVWHSIEFQSTAIGQHSQLWIETGIGSVLYQPNLQPVHRGQWSSFGGTSVKAIQALFSENACLHTQPSTSCPAWIWINHEKYVCAPAKSERRHDPNPDPCHWSQCSHGFCRDQCRMGLPPGDTQFFNQECTSTIPRGTTSLKESANVSLKESANVCSPVRKPRLSSMSIVKHKGHMMKFPLMAPKWTREWGQRRSSTAISRMVRQPATNCPKDYQTTAPSLQLRLLPSLWHWIYYRHGGPGHHDVIVYSDSMSCLQAIEG